MNKRQATHLAKLYVKALAKEMHDLAHWTHDDTEGITNGEALKEINHGLAN